jgi:hypothetical protein
MQLFGHYDCGGTHKNPDKRGRLPPTVSVAGYLFTYPQLFEFDRRWKKRLKADKFTEFHMTDFMANSYEFEKCKRWSENRKNAFLDDLISIIVNNVTFGIGMGVHRADYERILSEEPEVVHKGLGSPYAFCAFRCFESGADWSIQHRSPEPINYIFEHGDLPAHTKQIIDTHSFLSSLYPLMRRYWLGSLTFDPKENTALQAADLLTWELNRERYRQLYPEPEYAYTRPTLVALMQRVDGDYRGYYEEDLRAYMGDIMDKKKNKRRFTIINIPEDIAQAVLDSPRIKRIISNEAENRVPKVRRNNARAVSRTAKRTTKGTGKRRASKGAKEKAAR